APRAARDAIASARLHFVTTTRSFSTLNTLLISLTLTPARVSSLSLSTTAEQHPSAVLDNDVDRVRSKRLHAGDLANEVASSRAPLCSLMLTTASGCSEQRLRSGNAHGLPVIKPIERFFQQ